MLHPESLSLNQLSKADRGFSLDSVQADNEFLPSAAGADLKDLTECTGPTGILEHIPKAPPNAPEAQSPESHHIINT